MRIQYIKVEYSIQSSPSSSLVLPNTRLPLNPTLKVQSYNIDKYKEWENQYVDNNIQEIQELYKEVEQKKESNRRRVENKEVTLIKLYKELTTTSKTTELSFIHEEIKNLEWYIVVATTRHKVQQQYKAANLLSWI